MYDLIFNRLLEIVKVHVRAKFHLSAAVQSYRVNRENFATMLKTILLVLPRAAEITETYHWHHEREKGTYVVRPCVRWNRQNRRLHLPPSNWPSSPPGSAYRSQ